MGRSLADCFLQVLQLVWFCEKAKIPFEVFGFTEVHPIHLMGQEEFKKEQAKFLADDSNERFTPDAFRIDPIRSNPTNILHGQTKLINLASSRDDAAKRERLLAHLYNAWVTGTSQRPSCLSLGGTPTVEALALASQFIRDWVKAQNIQIPTVMLVTDGQPNGIYTANDTVSAAHWHQGQGTLTVMNEVYGTAHRIILKDHPYTCMGNLAVYAMLDSMRQTINARCVGMFVDSHNLSPAAFITFCMSNAERIQFEHLPGRVCGQAIDKSPRFLAMKDAFKEGAIMCHPDSVPGFDSFFVIKTPKIVKDEDAIAESGTFTKIKNTFVKTMAKRSGSRVFLTRYVDIVAGQKIGKDIGGEYNHALFAQQK
jgi:hypothetical protein